MIKIKRIYDKPEKSDGFRILVDRLWPRGMTKAEAKVDLWLKDVGPSTELRHWFGHDPAKWKEFERRYTKELDKKWDLIAAICEHEKKGTVTLLYGAKDQRFNNAVSLQEYIAKALVTA
jgi:uncharacterized protein YeaO (DUF488 family)